MGDLLIRSGEAELVVCGGMENMSAVPYLLPRVRDGLRMGDGPVIDGLIKDGLWCPFHQVHMGVHGGSVPASEYGIDVYKRQVYPGSGGSESRERGSCCTWHRFRERKLSMNCLLYTSRCV